MEQDQFQLAINQICDEKNIDVKSVISAIEAALVAAFRKDYGNNEQNLVAEMSEQTGVIKIYQIYDIVKKVEDINTQLLPSGAKKYGQKAKVGEQIRVDVTPDSYGRIAAQTAKQVIIQRVREAEREAIYNLYKDRVGEIINGQVQRIEPNGTVYIDIERANVPIEPKDQIRHERYYNGRRVKVLVSHVEQTTKGPAIIISRNSPLMVEKLLELEVPEISEGTVEIMGIAREPGVRTKVAVRSAQKGVDPVGSCVGQKGIRIQNITDELNEERIDIIEYEDDIVKYLQHALAPAKIISIKLIEDKKLAKVYVAEDQRSLAIGKNGQNVRLASRLVGWEIDIESWQEAEAEKDTTEEEATAEEATTKDETTTDEKTDTAKESTATEETPAPETDITPDDKI